MSKFFGWLLVWACVAIATPGWAAARGVVILAEGANAESMRKTLVASMPSGLPVQESAAFRRAVEAQGVKGTLADALTNPRTRKRALQATKKALEQVQADAVVAARSKRARGGDEVRLLLVVATQNDPVVEETTTIAKEARGKDAFAPLLGPPLQELADAATRASAPPAAGSTAPSTPSADKPAAAPPASAAATGDGEAVQATDPATELASGDNAGIDRVRRPVDIGNAMIVLDVGGGVGRRDFKYNDPLRGPVRDYLAPGMAMWSVAGQLYPLAETAIPIIKDLGITGSVAGALPITSKSSDGVSSAQASWTKYTAGARLRVRASSRPKPIVLGIEALYGGSNFRFSGSDPAGVALANEVPTVHYKYVRGGADVRLPIGSTPISLQAAAGFLRVLNAGAFSDRFPRASINGVDARLGAAFTFTPWLEAKLTGEYTRMFSSLKPLPGDPQVAGGALDQFFVLNVGASAMF